MKEIYKGESLATDNVNFLDLRDEEKLGSFFVAFLGNCRRLFAEKRQHLITVKRSKMCQFSLSQL